MNKLILLAALAATLFASTEAAIAITNGDTQTLAKGATVTVTGITSGNHLCWNAGSTLSTRSCAADATATDVGATGCSAPISGTSASLTWTTVAGVKISIIQCKASDDSDVDSAVALTFTEANIATAATQSIKPGAAVTVTSLGTGNYLCWTAATTATAATACAGVGTATDAGTTGCGALNNAAPVWTTVTNTHVSFIQCVGGGTTVAGTAVATVLTSTNIQTAATQSLKPGAAVTVTNLTTGNYLCWTAATSATATTSCAGVGTATDAGTTGCGALNNAAPVWTTVAKTNVSFLECEGGGTTVVGTAVATVLTSTNIATAATQTIEKGAAVTVTNLATGNHLCWTAATTATAITSCSAAATANDAGTSGCGAANDASLVWTTVANDDVSLIECDNTTIVGTAIATVLTEANIAITGGAAQTIAAGAALAVTELGSGRHLCWTAAATATAITSCSAAGTANDAGTSGCGAVDDASLVWTTVAGTHVSIIQCDNTTVVGSAVATVLTQQIVATLRQNITAGSEVTVTGLTTGNHLCWSASPTLANGGATCAAAGTATDIGTTGCGAANDAGLAWTNTNNTVITIRECKATTNANVGVQIAVILRELTTTTAAATTAAPATTTVSGASQAAWSSMLTVFAIAMAAFSTL